MNHRLPSLHAWLWWLAVLIAGTGGAIAYLFRLNTLNSSALAHSNMAIAITAILSGICVICATAGRWLGR